MCAINYHPESRCVRTSSQEKPHVVLLTVKPPVGNHQVFAFWAVTYRRFACIINGKELTSGGCPSLKKAFGQYQFKHWGTCTNSAVWPVPYACAPPYHPGRGSHGQLFRRYWGSSAWHSHQTSVRAKPSSDPWSAGQVQVHKTQIKQK